MTQYRYTVNLKTGLFAVGILIVAALLWYSQSLVRDLQVSRFRKNRVGFALELLEKKIQFLTGFVLYLHQRTVLVDMTLQPGDLFGDISLIGQ